MEHKGRIDGLEGRKDLEDRKDRRGNIIIMAGMGTINKVILRTRLDMEDILALISRTLALAID